MTDTQFLAEIILRLVPFGDMYINTKTGVQASKQPVFTVHEVQRLIAIRDAALTAPEGGTPATSRKNSTEAK